jgi:hypothetical protein
MTYSEVLEAPADSGVTATPDMTITPTQKARKMRVIVTI